MLFGQEHVERYRETGGDEGHEWQPGVFTLLLTTKGRHSGADRTAPLIYGAYGDAYVVVASNGGADKHPAWLHNLKAKPEVEIQIGRERHPATARVIERGDPDHERLWQLVNENNRGRYDAYQEMTSRPIPLVALTPSA